MRAKFFTLLFVVVLSMLPSCNTDTKIQVLEEGVTVGTFFEQFPYPAWVKDENAVIVLLNTKYHCVFKDKLGVETDSLIGNKGEVFNLETAEIFTIHDNLVKGRGKLLILEENITIRNKVYNGTSYKFPIYNKKEEFIGHMGYWVPDDHTLLQ